MEKIIPFRINSPIRWKWAGGIVEGRILEIYFGPIEKIIKGKKIKRNGSVQKPAYLVQSIVGNFALKLHTELISDKETKL